MKKNLEILQKIVRFYFLPRVELTKTTGRLSLQTRSNLGDAWEKIKWRRDAEKTDKFFEHKQKSQLCTKKWYVQSFSLLVGRGRL